MAHQVGSLQQHIWYRLVDSVGANFRNSRESKLRLGPETRDIDDLLDVIYKVNYAILFEDCYPTTLRAFKCRDSLLRNESIDERLSISELINPANAAPVLILVPDSKRRNERLTILTEKHGIFNNWTHEIHVNDTRDIDGMCLSLPYYLMHGSGLDTGPVGKRKVLFKRKSCAEEIEFILSTVLRGGRKGVVFGPPGTGKSTTAFYVACYVRDMWDVMWVHREVACDTMDVCIIRQNKMQKFHILPEDFHLIMSLQVPRKCLVIFDALDVQEPCNQEILQRTSKWIVDDPSNRRFLCICSSEASRMFRQKVEPPEEYRIIEKFRVDDWSLEEYKQAVRNHQFWNSVKHAFNGPHKARRIDLVRWKYMAYGIPARYMFT